MSIGRLKNKLIARMITFFPSLAERLTASYDPWKSLDIPWTPVEKALDKSTIAIVTTAGVHHKDQEPFNMKDREGDPSYRIIDLRRPHSSLMITHDYYDHADADRDINIVFPIERLKELEKEGHIGRVADRHYGFMGHIVGRHITTLISKNAPEVARSLKNDNVDFVLLTPGWGICNQSVGLVQREIEKAGIPTIGVSIVREYSEKVKPPRTIFLRWPFGHPFGEPFNISQQRVVLAEALRALYTIQEPGTIIDMPYRWRREQYDDKDISSILKSAAK